jgi:23S rRNA (uracil1939-C5)-methyltransferase
VSDISIVKLVAGGDGLGFLDGKAVFVPDTLPGEVVRVRWTQRHRDFDRAAVVEVRQPSPHRVTPPCRLAGRCGGCDWLHISYEEQLAQKISIVQEALRRVGRIEPPPLLIEPSPPLGSRSRAQIHRQGDTLGYMAARSNQLVKVETCPIVAPAIDTIFGGAVRTPDDRERFTVFGVGLSPDGTAPAVAVEGIDDDRDLTVSIRGRPITFSVGCFFQSNLAVLERLIPWAFDQLSGDVAADLYCGVGLFGVFLSLRFSRIICVEESATSMAYARRNITGTAAEFYPMSVEQWISSGGAARSAPDTVVADPPRIGLDPQVREWLCRVRPRTFLYVSCNPVTMARDLARLLSGGFRLDAIRLFDFYPQTSHVEVVAKLSGEVVPHGVPFAAQGTAPPSKDEP